MEKGLVLSGRLERVSQQWHVTNWGCLEEIRRGLSRKQEKRREIPRMGNSVCKGKRYERSQGGPSIVETVS